MHKWRELFSFCTKKSASPMGEEEGRINPEASDSPMRLSIAIGQVG